MNEKEDAKDMVQRHGGVIYHGETDFAKNK